MSNEAIRCRKKCFSDKPAGISRAKHSHSCSTKDDSQIFFFFLFFFVFPPFIIVPLRIHKFLFYFPTQSPRKPPMGANNWTASSPSPTLFITDISVHTLNTPSFSESNFWCPLSICSLVIVLCISYT